MSSTVKLSAHELELLRVALPFAQELFSKEERQPTRDELKRALSCGSDTAQRLLTYLLESEAVKVAGRLQAIPERAEDRALINQALGTPSGTILSHVVRENNRLSRALAKAKFEAVAGSEGLTQEIKDEIEALKKQAKEEIKRKPLSTKPVKETGLMLEVNIADAHFGKLAWPAETGGVPYDLKIADAMFMRALDVLLERAKGYDFERVLFVLGNDLLHANDVAGNTFNGTKLDTEGRFQKTYWTVRKTVCAAIERLRQVAPVKVAIVYGNHDRTSMWTLADSIDCYFHGDDRVEVDNQPIYRKYHEWGKVGLMLTHGDLGKRADFPLLFATENPGLFGRTEFREVHTGHLHTTKTEEFHGVRVRILPSLTPPDAWHAENGYVGNMRNAEAYVWSKTEGLIATFIYCDNAQAPIKTKREIK